MTRQWLRLGLMGGLIVVGLASVEVWAQAVTGSGAAAAPAPEAPPKIKEVDEAIAAFQKLDFDGALKLLETASKNHPDLAPPQVLMALLFAQANQPNGVRISLERAVVQSPEDPEAYVILAEVALRDGRVTESALLYDQARGLVAKYNKSTKRRDALSTRISSGLAAVAEARGDWATAQKHLEATQKIAPKEAMAGVMLRLARVLFQQKDAATSLDKLKEAKKVDPDNVLTPEALLAQFYEQFGDRKNAEKWMGNALKAAPKDPKTLLVAGQFALQIGKVDDALKHATAAMEIDPKSLDALVLRGVVALFQKDYKAAEGYFESAHLMSPGSFAASNNLALALCEQTDEAKKRRALEYASNNARQFQRDQRAPEALSTYGWVLYSIGRNEKGDRNPNLDAAEQALRQAASSGNISSDTAYYLAQVLFEKGNKDDARQLLEAALKSERPFSRRDDAQKLLNKIGAKEKTSEKDKGNN